MIVVEGVSKRYRLGGGSPRHLTLRDAIGSRLGRVARRAVPWGRHEAEAAGPAADDTFYALRQVSFAVAAGEVVAVIGRNGAGKSTLLKILSRITWPSEGRVALYGRPGSVLEIGAGFHGDLTGRENVFLSASVLGMSRAETRRQFDEIVAFSGIEKFIDMPVKFYSSGMYVRLAFSIASSVQPDILFIDEALGVGDAQFQRRCHERIRQIGQSGRTVVFVTHSAQLVAQLSRRALWLDAGELRFDGDVHQAVAAYLGSDPTLSSARRWNDLDAPGDDCVRLRSVRIVGENGCELSVCEVGGAFGVELVFDVMVDGHVIVPRLEFCNAEGACLFWCFEVESPWHGRSRPAGRYRSTAWLPPDLFVDGPLSIGVAIQSFSPWLKHVDETGVVTVLITEPDPATSAPSARGNYPGHIPGFIRPRLRWTTEAP